MATTLEADRAELLELLCADGIFRSTPERPIATRDGVPAAWMLDTLRVSLTTRGAELAGRLLLDRLSGFRGRQLATYGITAIPLLQACVAASGGRYRGIVVRKEPKAYGAQKQIEGPCDVDEQVIVIDDSISSGGSITQCVDLLEKAGFRVEGGVTLVRFGWFGGFARMIERGYRMETVYEVHRDLVSRVEPERPVYPYNPSAIVPPFTWAETTAADGMHPASYAREVLARHLRGEPVPRPPRTLDKTYDSAGGTWVSVRSRANLHLRHARDGLWVFPGEPRRDTGEDIARAAIRAARSINASINASVSASVNASDNSPDHARGKAAELVDDSGIAVTFFGALEPCTVGGLDNDRYGIVVRSAERIECLGGALPRMPGMNREWAQFDHARRNNAKLAPFEPFVLFRHTVDKAVEPGIPWQPTGVPRELGPRWQDDPSRAGLVATRAHAYAVAAITGAPVRGEPLPPDVIGPTESVFLSIFIGGEIVGCMGGKVAALDDELRRLTDRALADARFLAKPTPERIRELAVTIAFLCDPTPMGVQSKEDIAIRVRLGDQALLAFQGTRMGLLLPFVVLQHSLTPLQYVVEVIDKAGITRPPYSWALYDVETWLSDGDVPRKMVFGLPPGTPPANLGEAVAALTPRFVGYLLRHHRPDGLRDGHYRPFLDRVVGELDLPRQVHGTWTLARAHRVLGDPRLGDAARASLAALEGRLPAPSLLEATFLLLSRAELGLAVDPEPLVRAIDRHGRIGGDADRDYLPPQVLLALAAAARDHAIDRATIERAIGECRHQFLVKHGWGQVSWLPQALAAWYPRTKNRAHAELAFEVIDWALDYQQATSGGFINAEQPDSPGYTTGVYLEGVAAALGLAHELGDANRIARYRAAATRAAQFLDALVYQERDRPLLPNPERAYGGVRLSRTAGDVRIDFVQHALNAMMLLRPLTTAP